MLTCQLSTRTSFILTITSKTQKYRFTDIGSELLRCFGLLAGGVDGILSLASPKNGLATSSRMSRTVSKIPSLEEPWSHPSTMRLDAVRCGYFECWVGCFEICRHVMLDLKQDLDGCVHKRQKCLARRFKKLGSSEVVRSPRSHRAIRELHPLSYVQSDHVAPYSPFPSSPLFSSCSSQRLSMRASSWRRLTAHLVVHPRWVNARLGHSRA